MAANTGDAAAPARLYAELLSNIRQVSIIASLEPPALIDTRANITKDGTFITLIHNGVTTELQLPAVVANGPLALPPAGSKEASWRLSLLDPTIRRADEFGQDNIAPWSATSLQKGQDFSCRKCGALVVPSGTILDWKDLPSENWAEMMDFWHCHKPHDHKHESTNGHNEDQLAERGYGANTRFEARQSTGYVDLTYILLSEEDCQNIQANHTLKTLNCSVCDCPLGHPDTLAQGNRLSKWSLSSSYTNPSPPTISQLISSTLLYLSTSQNIKKFLIHSPSPVFSLDIWLFAPLVTFSSTVVSSPSPTTATKLFYHVLGEEETSKKRETLSDSVEEIEVPDFVVNEVLRVLKESTSMLPVSARAIAGWEVGFLERFTG